MSSVDPVSAQPEASVESKEPGTDYVGMVRDFFVRADKRDLAAWGLVAAGIGLLFWHLFLRLPDLWFAADTYYAHGVIIPFCSAVIIYDRWDKIKQLKVKPVYLAVVPVLFCTYVMWVGTGNSTRMLMSIAFIATMMFGTLMVFGWAIMRQVWPAIMFLAFALPMWDAFIDRHTQTLQRMSTDMSYVLLQSIGQSPFRSDPTLIMLDNFTLNVGAPCSGLKLMLAVASIVVFFVLIGKLRWWGNLILLASAVPLTLAINGIRITMIGVVGNMYGSEAGMQFHDYSGYISLVIAFVVLMKLAKALGWK